MTQDELNTKVAQLKIQLALYYTSALCNELNIINKDDRISIGKQIGDDFAEYLLDYEIKLKSRYEEGEL